MWVGLCPVMTWEKAMFGRYALQTDQQSRKCPLSRPQLAWGDQAPPPLSEPRSGFQMSTHVEVPPASRAFSFQRKWRGCRAGSRGARLPFCLCTLPAARLVQGVHLLPVLLQCHRHKGRSECGELGGHRPQGRRGSTRRAPPQGSPGAQTLAARARQRCPGSWPAWRVARGLRHVRRTPHPALV